MNHKISKIRIENFKSIRNESFDLFDYTPLVGYNNAGKTNLIEAIKWILRKSSLSANYFNDPTQPIVMEATIDGINDQLLTRIADNHRTSIQPFLIDESLSIKRVQTQPGQAVAQIRLFVRIPNPEDGQDEWQANPTGIDNAIKDLFPEPIHIGAMENSEEDVSKSKSTTTIGKLLGEIFGPIETRYGENIRTVLHELKEIMDAEGGHRAAELTEFDTSVNQKIDSFFPDINIRVHVPTPELKEVFSKGTIKVYENQLPEGRDVSALGHGAQRSIQMALVRHLSDIQRAVGTLTSTTLLLIDEPELYLHPQAIEIIRESLKALAGQNYQIIFSTHSPVMITSKDVANTILIRKNATQGTFRRQSLRSAIPQVEIDAASQLVLLFSLSNSSNILFSERVILAEGKTENRLMPTLVQKVTGRALGLHKIAFVPQNGSGNTRKSMMVLNVMDLPTKALVDLDFCFKNAISDGFINSNDPDIVACSTHLRLIAASNGISLGQDGWPIRNNTMSSAEAFSILASQTQIRTNIENLKTKMLNHNIWIWKKGTIENHLNLTSKTEQEWSRFNTLLDTNELNAILPNDFQEIIDCVNWITN